MRTLPPAMQAIIDAGDFTGENVAVTRVTIQQVVLGVYPVGERGYSSIVFPSASAPAMELPNVSRVTWDRNVDSAVGSCTIELINSEPLPPGQVPAAGDVFDQLGYYTFNRGLTPDSKTLWGHTENAWQDMLTPDRVLRVYQGYGADYNQVPELDPHMLLMGCYVTDEVTYDATGTITVASRDFGRLLIEQIAFPPVIPLKNYPVSFEHRHLVIDPDVTTTTTKPGTPTFSTWTRGSYSTDSNVPYNGRNGSEHGHHGSDAFDANAATYWLSIGNLRPTQGYSFEHVEGKVAHARVGAVRANVWGGPYTYYVSVKVGNTWQGSSKVPYDPNNPASAPNHSDILFVATGRVARDGTLEVHFAEYSDVTAVRVTFTDLFNSGLGIYPYRAGVRSLEHLVINPGTPDTTVTTVTPGLHHVEGNFKDFTDIVKLLLAYGGFYWTPEGKQLLTARQEDPTYGHTVFIQYAENDPVLGVGRVWGDLQDSMVPEMTVSEVLASAQVAALTARRLLSQATAELAAANLHLLAVTQARGDVGAAQVRVSVATVARLLAHERALVADARLAAARVSNGVPDYGIVYDITMEVFDKKPLMDGITHIKDLLGFLFYIDEQGAAQWRLPNLFAVGNYRTDSQGLNLAHTTDIITLSDDDFLLTLRTALSSHNLRELVLIGDTTGKVGAAAAGRFDTLPKAGFRRVAIWTDQGFSANGTLEKQIIEAQRMADMIALRQMFTYRQNTARIPANPAIQIDDQIHLRERTTGEDYVHYVSAISSQWDLTTGVWTYDLTTQWLGTDPAGEWAFHDADLSQETKDFLNAISNVPVL